MIIERYFHTSTQFAYLLIIAAIECAVQQSVCEIYACYGNQSAYTYEYVYLRAFNEAIYLDLEIAIDVASAVCQPGVCLCVHICIFCREPARSVCMCKYKYYF